MNRFYRKYIGQVVKTESGDNVQIVAVDYGAPYMYGYSDNKQEYVIVDWCGLNIVRNITFERLRIMAEEGRVYT